jgi:hypothetical protein
MWVCDCLRAGRFYSEPAADDTKKMLIVGNGSIARELFTNGDCAYGIRRAEYREILDYMIAFKYNQSDTERAGKNIE